MTVQVKSEIAGRVIQLVVAVGTRVEPESTLLIVESMKMEIPLEAPRAGVVREILVAEGDAVAEGDVLVVLE